MGEKTIVVYISDEEYVGRFIRALNKRKPAGVVIERVTEREAFWEKREKARGNQTVFWLTDDMAGDGGDGCEGATGDPGASGAGRRKPGGKRQNDGQLIRLAPRSDHRNNVVSYCQEIGDLSAELFGCIGLSGTDVLSADGPVPGIYGIYAPYGEPGHLLGALLSQELAVYGSCLYVNTSAFPLLYQREDPEEKRHLGELFFRLDGKGFSELESKLERDYGAARRLPTIVHYRDLWDIGEREFGVFLQKLKSECQKSFVVICFNDIREAMPMVRVCDFFCLVGGRSCEDIGKRWMSYAAHESDEGAKEVRLTVLPAGYESWSEQLARDEPGQWLKDPVKKSFVQGIWREESL